MRKRLCEGVGKVVHTGDACNIKGAIIDVFSDVVVLHVDMFALRVVCGVI